jgi:hypothetical protein
VADPGRVVVVAAGFALWSGGRCVAAARWSDVRRLRAYRRGDPPADAMRLAVELVDDTVMELHEEAPGFDAFLNRATATLTGLRPVGDWHHALDAMPAASESVVVFERKASRY